MDVTVQDGANPLRVLYIDDEADKVAFMVEALTPDNIDAFAANPNNAGVLSECQVALLKRVQLTPVLNNPTEDQLKQDTLPEGMHCDDPGYGEYEARLTPASRVARDIYNGNYDVVITDMNMPAGDSHATEKFGRGGNFTPAWRVSPGCRLSCTPMAHGRSP
jgi:CheY-like chemotaxis protein